MGALILYVLVAALLIYGTLRMGEHLVLLLKRKGTVRVVWIEPDARSCRIEYVKRTQNEVALGKGDDARRVLLEGEACMMGSDGKPTYLIHTRHGWNLKAPTPSPDGAPGVAVLDAPTDQELRAIVPGFDMLAVSNPHAYHHAIVRNEARDALEANKDPDDWIKTVAVCGMVVLVALVLMVGWIAYKISHAAQGAGA